jgi:hypothetical protein
LLQKLAENLTLQKYINPNFALGINHQTVFTLQSFHDYLPPWLGGKHPRRQPFESVLKALKAATEACLENTVSSAEVVVPFPINKGSHEALRSACSAVSIQVPNSAQPAAGILAARAYGIGTKRCLDTPEDDPQQLILTVEYSRAALTALVVFEECTIFEQRRVLHDTNLGLDQLHGHSELSNHQKLENADRKLVRLPMNDDDNGEELTYIHNLVLLGESADNARLHDVLKKVLAEQYERLVASASRSGLGVPNPLSAASRGLAFDCWDRLNFADHEALS